METHVIVLCGIAVFLLVMNSVDRWQASKRERDLHDRLMARSLDEYAANRVRMSTTKPEYIGEVGETEDETYPVD